MCAASTTRPAGLALDRLLREARERGIPEEIADAAASTTRQWARQKGIDSVARVRDYFWGVVRNRAFRQESVGTELRRRFVIASMVEDLRQAGFDEDRIGDEVRRMWGVQWPERRAVA